MTESKILPTQQDIERGKFGHGLCLRGKFAAPAAAREFSSLSRAAAAIRNPAGVSRRAIINYPTRLPYSITLLDYPTRLPYSMTFAARSAMPALAALFSAVSPSGALPCRSQADRAGILHRTTATYNPLEPQTSLSCGEVLISGIHAHLAVANECPAPLGHLTTRSGPQQSRLQ
jgi:hypothetical protein